MRFVRKDTEQYHLCLGGHGIARDDERRFALRVLDNVLGGSASSRLFQEVRERRGLAYAVFSFSNLYAATGEVGLYVGTRPENLAEALAVIAAELERFVDEPADAQELERSRENVEGPSGALAGVDRRAHEPSRELGAERTADPLRRGADRPDRRRHRRGPARAVRRLLPAPRLSVAAIGPDEDALRRGAAPAGGSPGVIAVAVSGAAGRMGADGLRRGAGRRRHAADRARRPACSARRSPRS